MTRMHAAGFALVSAVTISGAASAVPLDALRGPARPAGHAGSSSRGGWLIAVDAGWSFLAADGSAPALGFSARAGYAFAGGASIDVAYDDVGVPLTAGAGALQAVSAGLRYELPLDAIPFAEVRVGSAFQGANAWPAGSMGLGVALPLAHAVRVQLTARDWLVPQGAVRSVFGALLGLEVRL